MLPTYLFVLRSYLFVCHKRFLLHPVNNVHLHTDTRIIFVNPTVFAPTPTRYNECYQQTLLLFPQAVQRLSQKISGWLAIMSRSALLKEEGNLHFKNGDYVSAEALYSKA